MAHCGSEEVLIVGGVGCKYTAVPLAVSVWVGVCRGGWQAPSTGLRHPSFNHCRISHAIGLRKLSTNKQFFVGAQTVLSLLQTAQIKQGVSFFFFFFTRGGYASCLRACLGARLLLQSY